MQSLRNCLSKLLRTEFNLKLKTKLLPAALHSSPVNKLYSLEDNEADKDGPRKWLKYNEIVLPPQKPGEARRPAYICHVKKNIKYSPKTMWYIACLVRGMSIDEAIRQLSFLCKKGAVAAKETLLEAQQLAVEKHNVEFKSNLWVSESFVGKGVTVKGIRRHARARIGRVDYKHVHYFVKLEEGKPPKNYYLPEPQTKQSLLEEWLDQMRHRKITNSL
ncbi:39S ribosomal protein L22, mitochondrial-like [Cotesia glomerata]|uniref:Large ribosomal subunit protein uL22m n=1 Tax=Cotesia glomerata TaxID=32391 RepID=A0AAV7IRA3_COTGL|nr:39S ribosomal protein L22, mitochondrial-like [Cotesia glomerata]KAH0555429.1 54S ribosomal protein L22, mitochondrial [Cotesia glomerata]